jgi:hypothetical protein
MESLYEGVELAYELSKDQGACFCGSPARIVTLFDGETYRLCVTGHRTAPLVDAVYRMNANMRIVGGSVIERPDIDPYKIAYGLIRSLNKRTHDLT